MPKARKRKQRGSEPGTKSPQSTDAPESAAASGDAATARAAPRRGRPRLALVLLTFLVQGAFLFACYELARRWALPEEVLIDDAIAVGSGAAFLRLDFVEDVPPLLRSDPEDWTIELWPRDAAEGSDEGVLRGSPDSEGLVRLEGPLPSGPGRFAYRGRATGPGGAEREHDVFVHILPPGRKVVLASLVGIERPLPPDGFEAVQFERVRKAFEELASDRTILWLAAEPWPRPDRLDRFLERSRLPSGPLVYLVLPARQSRWVERELREWIRMAIAAGLDVTGAVTVDPVFAEGAGALALRTVLVDAKYPEGYVMPGVARVNSWEKVAPALQGR
ncbi:MAG TPA: hypothetical protein VK116_11235 [Planctomycetota bacterium]|nr:hypothetical protein [Planctomycetota bacterium]